MIRTVGYIHQTVVKGFRVKESACDGLIQIGKPVDSKTFPVPATLSDYNHWKQHQSLGYKTPWECYRPEQTPAWEKAA